jgi:hypothetical protein
MQFDRTGANIAGYSNQAGGNTSRQMFRGRTSVGDLYKNRDIGGLIDRQFGQSDQFRQQQRADRDAAIGYLDQPVDTSSIDDMNSIIDAELQRLNQPNEQFNTVRQSIQSVLDDPKVLSDEQLAQLREDARQRNLEASIQARDAAMSQAAGSGRAGFGQTAEQQAQLYNQGTANTLRDINQLEYDSELASAERLANAQNTLANFELGADSLGRQSISQLLGTRAGLAGLLPTLDQNQRMAIAELLGNTVYQPDDFGSIAALIAAEQGAEEERGFRNQEYDIIQQQLDAQRDQFAALNNMLGLGGGYGGSGNVRDMGIAKYNQAYGQPTNVVVNGPRSQEAQRQQSKEFFDSNPINNQTTADEFTKQYLAIIQSLLGSGFGPTRSQ